MSLSTPFIKRPIGTSLLAAGVMITGLICYMLLGISALPQITFPAIFVSASEPGADAATMAATVASPLERHLGQIPGIDTMRSNSSEGRATVILLFQGGVDVDAAAREVQQAINAAAPDLPAGLPQPPTYQKANPNDDPIIQFALTSDTEPLSSLFDDAQTLLQPRMSQLPGVASVEVSGSAQPAIRVDVDLHALDAVGLSSNDLRNALTAANVTSPQGFLSDGRTQMSVTANDQLHTAEDFADLVIAEHNGVPVFLRDVAHVYQGAEDSYQAAWFNGKRAIEMDVYKRADANIITTVDAIKAELPRLRALLPPGTQLTPYFDGTPTVRASVDDVQITLLISLCMVVLTMALFLRRLAPTVIAALAVPMSLAGAFIVMYVMDYTLDNLSLLALVIAIGFVVDDAIVVIENVIRHIDEGQSRLQATLNGAREIGFTIVAITLSLIAVFLPLLFASGIIGMFFREFTVVLVSAIAVSAIISLTLTPSLCGVFLSPHPEHAANSRMGRVLDRVHAGMLAVYRTSLDWTLRHPRLLALMPLVLVGVTIFLFGMVRAGFFPPQDTGLIRGIATGGSTPSFSALEKREERLLAMLRADPAVEDVSSSIGSSWHGAASRYSIQLKQLGEGRSESTQEVLARLSAKAAQYPDLNLRLRAHQDLPTGGGGSEQGAQYQVSLKGNDLGELQEWLPKLQAQLQKNPMFRDVGSDVDDAGLRQNIVVDRNKASQLGISIAAVDDALYNAFGQRQISTIYSDTNQYAVVLTALASESATPAALNRLYLHTSNGTLVPLSAIAHQQPGLAPAQISHENQFTIMDLSFNLAPGISMGQATTEIQKTIDGMRMPGDIQLSLGGDFRRFQQQQSNMPFLILGAILAVYIVLGMLYESLIHPVTILSTLPSAGVGALLALVLTNTELSIVADMALVLLIGLVKKNAIMMIDFALVAQRAGRTPLEAIREACLVRFRPIMMTTMVAILASLPLAIGIGTGAELRRPLGIAMLGGLIVSQCLTLLSVPALYLVFARWSQRRRDARAQRLAARGSAA